MSDKPRLTVDGQAIVITRDGKQKRITREQLEELVRRLEEKL